MQFSQFSSLELPQNQTLKFNKHVTVLPTVILQIFVVDLFSVISVVNGFTKIKTHLNEKITLSDYGSIHGHGKFKRKRTLCERSLPKF